MFNPISNYDLSALDALEVNHNNNSIEECNGEVLLDVAIVVNTSVVIFASEQGYYSFNSDHNSFNDATTVALECLDDSLITQERWDYLGTIHSIEKALVLWSNGRLSVEGDRVRFDGDLLPPSLETHLLNLYKTGKEYALSAWSKFTERLREASHADTHNRLHAFLQYNDLAINEDGNVLAWKVVREDFKDKHSGTFDNSVGNVVSMPRVKVTFDPTQTCSSGLHACAYGYLKSFASRGDQVILVEIDVRDIVSVPIDYDGKKIRCCKYVVSKHVGTWGVDINETTEPRAILERL